LRKCKNIVVEGFIVVGNIVIGRGF